MENFVVISVDAQDYGFKFTLKSLDLICDKGGFDYHELLDAAAKKPFSVINLILQGGYENYHRGEKSLDVYQVDDLIEGMTPEQLQQVWECFELSFTRLADRMAALREGSKKK